MSAIGLYRNPLTYSPYCQYIAPQGCHFVCNGENVGRIVWIRDIDVGRYYIENDQETKEKEL